MTRNCVRDRVRLRVAFFVFTVAFRHTFGVRVKVKVKVKVRVVRVVRVKPDVLASKLNEIKLGVEVGVWTRNLGFDVNLKE